VGKRRWEYLRAIDECYQKPGRKGTKAILSEFSSNADYHRKFAIWHPRDQRRARLCPNKYSQDNGYRFRGIQLRTRESRFSLGRGSCSTDSLLLELPRGTCIRDIVVTPTRSTF
jgi:hypothetical protein